MGNRNLPEYHPVHPFVYDPSTGTATLLGPLFPLLPDAIAAAINDAGVVVGRSQLPANSLCGGMTINFRAVYWNPPDPTPDEIPPLGSGYESHALAVDPLGRVFGDSSDGTGLTPCDPPLAFSWTPGSPRSVNLNSAFLGSMVSRVYGVNASDQTVGFYGGALQDPGFAFVMNSNLMYSTIPVLYRGDQLNVAYSINFYGWVVGAEGVWVYGTDF